MGRATLALALISVAPWSPCLVAGMAPQSIPPAAAQDPHQATPNARDLLHQGINEYRWGRYEKASWLFEQAARQPHLTDQEREILARYRALTAPMNQRRQPLSGSPSEAPRELQQGNQEPTGSPGLSPELQREAYRQRLAQARKLIDSGFFEDAERLIDEAEAYRGSTGLFGRFFGNTPERLRRDLARARARARLRNSTPSGSAAGGTQSEVARTGGDAREEALELLRLGRAQLRAGRLDEAQRYMESAREKQAKYRLFDKFRLFDDTPNRLAADIARVRAYQQGQKDKPAATSLLAEARNLLKQGHLDEAESKARQAQELQVRYGWFEDHPGKLLADVRRARQRSPFGDWVKSSQPTETLPASSVATETTIVGEPPSLLATDSTAPVITLKPASTVPTPEQPHIAQSPSGIPGGDREMIVLDQPPATSPRSRASQASGAVGAMENSSASQGGAPNVAHPPHEVSELLSVVRSEPPRPEDAPHQTPGQHRGTPATSEAPSQVQQSGNRVTGVLQKLWHPRQLFSRGKRPQVEKPTQELEQIHPAPTAQVEHLKSPAERMQQSTALQLYEAGVAALKKQDYARALELFRQVASSGAQLDPATEQQLQNYLSFLPARIASASPGVARVADGAVQTVGATDPATPPGAMQDLSQRASIELQKLATETHQSIKTARELLKSDPAQAIKELQLARERVLASSLSEDLTARLVLQVESNMRNANQEKQRLELEAVQQQAQRARREQEQRRLAVETQTQQEVTQLLGQSQALIEEGRFAEAEMVARQAEEIDPDNPATVAMAYKAKMENRLASQRDILDRKEQGVIEAMESVDEASIPFDDRNPIVYTDAKTWDDLTSRRKDLFDRIERSQKSPLELEIEQKLNEPTSFNFTETPLADVVSFLRDFTGVNIVIEEQALAADGITSDRPMTLRLEGVPLKSALKHLLGQLNLTYAIRDDALVITTPAMQQGDLITKTYSVADLVLQIPNLGPNSLGMVAGGNFPAAIGIGPSNPPSFVSGQDGSPLPSVGLGQVAGTAPAGSFGGGTLMGGDANGTSVQPPRAQAVDFDALIELIMSTIAPDSWIDVGGPGSIEQFEPNLSLVVSQTQDVHEQIADLLQQLRRLQDLQVTVEVRFVTLTEDFFERIGLDFDMNIQSDSQKPLRSFGSVVTPADPTAVPPAPAVLNPFFLDHDDDTGVGLFGPSNAFASPVPPFTSDLKIPFRTGGFGAGRPESFVTGDGLSFGIAFLSDIEVFLFLEAAQRDDRSNVLQAPKVTLFNGSTAFVFSGTLEPFVTALTPVVQAGAVAFTPQISQQFNGPFLVVTAVISADRRYVRLTLTPFFTNIIRTERFEIQGAAAGAGLAGGGAATIATEIVVPVIGISFVLTTVSVPDGGTILMGGLKNKNEVRTELGVPILNKLPYLNRLFMNTGVTSESTSLMLLVTPRIIIQEEEEELLGKTVPF